MDNFHAPLHLPVLRDEFDTIVPKTNFGKKKNNNIIIYCKMFFKRCPNLPRKSSDVSATTSAIKNLNKLF